MYISPPKLIDEFRLNLVLWICIKTCLAKVFSLSCLTLHEGQTETRATQHDKIEISLRSTTLIR